MKLLIRRTTQFKKDVKRMVRRGKDLEKLLAAIVEQSAQIITNGLGSPLYIIR